MCCKLNTWQLLQRKLIGYSSLPILHMLLLWSLVLESAGPLAVIITPCLLTLSPVLVRGQINSIDIQYIAITLFHATVCKHKNVVRMLYCQTKHLPMYLVLEAYSPGNLLHSLWTLRNVTVKNSNVADPSLNFSERSVLLVAKQVAAGQDYLMSEHRLVHGDVAARNILIGPVLSARVSGLGGAFRGRKMDPPIRRRAAEVAPESIGMQLSIDRSDVYELITLSSPPYPELEPLYVLSKLQGSYQMKRPENCGGPL
ncbi:tyrosine-protein kinase STYK1 [Cebidichthys violaceus]|uniref:tyrosine-protein kinase STYK1 n=1 Tax=Cebidichthys violaceus TaxID=271503 RepID=UPI0035CC6B69